MMSIEVFLLHTGIHRVYHITLIHSAHMHLFVTAATVLTWQCSFLSGQPSLSCQPLHYVPLSAFEKLRDRTRCLFFWEFHYLSTAFQVICATLAWQS